MEKNPSATHKVPSKKSINIIIAENGTLNEYPLSKFVSQTTLKKPSHLMEFIDREFGIEKSSQVILRKEDGRQLEANSNLEEFFDKESSIYVYNKKFYRKKVISDDFEVIGAPAMERKYSESVVQFLPALYQNLLGEDMKKRVDPENTHRFEELIASFSELKNEVNSLKDGTIKLKRQKDSESVAKKNLVNYYLEKKRKFDDTLASMEHRVEKFQLSLQNYDENVQKLQDTKIDPSIQEEEEKENLGEYFNLEKIGNSKTTYEKNQEKIKLKIKEVKEEIKEYDLKLTDMQENIPEISEELQKKIQDIELIMVDLQDSNIQELKIVMDKSNGKPDTLAINLFVYKEYERLYPRFKEVEASLSKLRVQLDEQLKENAVKLKDFITDIAHLQLIIRGKISNKLTVFSNILDKHEKDMFNLEIIEQFPLVYQKSLDEIQRRSAFKRDYLTLLMILENFANSENHLREDFLHKFQQFLPKSFCPFLSKSFPQLNFENIRKVLNSDIHFDVPETNPNLLKANESADILKLLKNLNENAQTRETRINELEENLKIAQDQNEKLKEQVKLKGLTVNNLRRLFGSTGFHDKIEKTMDLTKQQFEDKIKKMEQKIKQLKEEKLGSLVIEFNNLKEKLEERKGSSMNESEIQSIKEAMEADFQLARSRSQDDKTKLISDLKSQLEDATLKLSGLEKDHKILVDESHQIKEKLKRAEQEKLKSTSQIETLQIEVEQAKNTTQKKDNDIKNLQDEITNHQEGARMMKQEIKENNDEIEKLKATLRESEEKIEVLSKELVKTTEQLQAGGGKVVDLDKKDKEIKELKQQLKELNEQVAQQVEGQIPEEVTKVLLADYGEAILQLYNTVASQDEFLAKSQRELDLKDLISEVQTIIEKKMIKVCDFSEGDFVAASKIPMSDKEYELVFQQSIDKSIQISYIFFSSNPNLGHIIKGKVKSIKFCQDGKKLEKFKKYLQNLNLIEVELVDVETLSLFKH